MRMQITRRIQLEDEKCYHIDRIVLNSTLRLCYFDQRFTVIVEMDFFS